MAGFNQFLTSLLNQSPALGVAVMMNNYFHDVATATLMASALCLYAIVKVRDRQETLEALTQKFIGEATRLDFSKSEIRQMVSDQLKAWNESNKSDSER